MNPSEKKEQEAPAPTPAQAPAAAAAAATGRHRRSILNFLLQPSVQLEIVALVIIMNILFSAVIVWILNPEAGFRRLELYLDPNAPPSGWMLALGVVGTTLIYSVLCAAAIIVYTHRLTGPMVAFGRHIRALRSGDFAFRTHLRPKDKWMEFAEELNRLSEQLEKRTSGRAASRG